MKKTLHLLGMNVAISAAVIALGHAISYLYGIALY